MASRKTRSERAAARARRRRNQRILLISALVLVVAAITYLVIGPDLFSSQDGGTAGSGEVVTTDSGLQYEDLVVGEGPAAQAGQTVSVHYVGTLEDGSQFDSSRDRGQPFQFTLGTGSVIAGWEEGVAGMQVGGIRRLTIPPELGYGAAGAPPVIPPNATLIFEVELLDIQ